METNEASSVGLLECVESRTMTHSFWSLLYSPHKRKHLQPVPQQETPSESVSDLVPANGKTAATAVKASVLLYSGSKITAL